MTRIEIVIVGFMLLASTLGALVFGMSISNVTLEQNNAVIKEVNDSNESLMKQLNIQTELINRCGDNLQVCELVYSETIACCTELTECQSK